MNFTEFCEEWKPFPKDKVNRKIEKKEKSGDSFTKSQAHAMKAVKNYKTRNVDFHKADQKLTGKDKDKYFEKIDDHTIKGHMATDKMNKSYNKSKKAADKGKQNKADKHFEKSEKHRDNSNKHYKRSIAMNRINMSSKRATKSEDEQQAEINKKDKSDRATAKSMMQRAGLESAYKKSNDKPTSKTESMDFTEWKESLCDPIYEANGEMVCPPGYKFNKKNMRCEPKTEKDDVSGGRNKESSPENGPGFNVIGSHGQNGAPYAYAEAGDGGGE